MERRRRRPRPGSRGEKEEYDILQQERSEVGKSLGALRRFNFPISETKKTQNSRGHQVLVDDNTASSGVESLRTTEEFIRSEFTFLIQPKVRLEWLYDSKLEHEFHMSLIQQPEQRPTFQDQIVAETMEIYETLRQHRSKPPATDNSPNSSNETTPGKIQYANLFLET